MTRFQIVLLTLIVLLFFAAPAIAQGNEPRVITQETEIPLLAISAILGIPVAFVIETLKPGIRWLIKADMLYVAVLRGLAFLAGVVILLSSGNPGMIGEDPILSLLPYWLAVIAGAFVTAFSSAIAANGFALAAQAERRAQAGHRFGVARVQEYKRVDKPKAA